MATNKPPAPGARITASSSSSRRPSASTASGDLSSGKARRLSSTRNLGRGESDESADKVVRSGGNKPGLGGESGKSVRASSVILPGPPSRQTASRRNKQPDNIGTARSGTSGSGGGVVPATATATATAATKTATSTSGHNNSGTKLSSSNATPNSGTMISKKMIGDNNVNTDASGQSASKRRIASDQTAEAAAATTTSSSTNDPARQVAKQREESQEASYLNQSARESLTGSTPADSHYNSNRRLTDDVLDNSDEFATSGGHGGIESGTSSHHRYLSPPAGLTKNLIWAVIASAVGSSFQHGYNGGVVNAPEKLIGEFINQTYKNRHGEWATETQIDFLFAIIVSIFCIGGCIGALLTALVADKVGRKEGLMYNNLIVLAASPMMASARSLSSYELLILGRLLIGVNAGLNAGLAPLYLNEIAPIRLRGAFGTMYQLVITISILLSNIFGLQSLLGDHDSWPILFAIPIIPAAFMLAALPHCYESPKHLLLNQGKELQAQQALAWFRQTVDVQDEMEELRYERETNMIANRTVTLRSMLEQPYLRKPLTIAIVIMLSQQFSGINAVLFYSTSIFRDAGLGAQAAVKATLGMSSVNVIMTLVSLFLVDRAGRRTLHMTGLMGMAATCLVLAVCIGSAPSESNVTSSISVIAIYIFIGMFAIGPGAIPWFLVAELFPSNARPIASSIAVAVNWLANFTVSLCFLPLSNILFGYIFILFAILLVSFYLFTYYKVPETKGATSEEISALFMRH